jgi:predicted molibdopterin-dependent oxidoreductase YjgC
MCIEPENSRLLDAFRQPLSSIRDADVVVVLGDEPVAERAPIVDLWIRAARRKGAEILYDLDDEKVRGAERAILIWSGGDGEERLAAHAQRLGVHGAFYLPRTPNARGITEAWAAAADAEDADNPDPVKLLIISGDEALANPDVRALAEQAENVIVISMFSRPARALATLLLPGTSYLERDGTYVNLEGRVQRLRRSVMPPAPDELAWISKLAQRFDVELSPYTASVLDEVSALIYGGIPFGAVGEHAPLHERARSTETAPAPPPASVVPVAGLRLVTYHPLFSGPAVERVPELQFQRPAAQIEVAFDDARRLGIATGDEVDVRSNGTSVRLRARVSRSLKAGTVRAADEHAAGLHKSVTVSTP